MLTVGGEVRYFDVQNRVLVVRIVDDHVHDEDASQLRQFDCIPHRLLALAEDVPAVAEHQQQILKQIVVACTAGRVLLAVNAHEIKELCNSTLVLVKVEALHQFWTVELFRVCQDDFRGFAKGDDTKWGQKQ